MFFIPTVFLLLVCSKSIAHVVITAQDLITETKTLLQNVTARAGGGWDIESFLKKNGYPLEDHAVTTEDGYILGVHRIPYGRNSAHSDDETRPTVLIMHGMSSSSADFVYLGPDRSLALLLADQGYDVWLGNNRGNSWSRNHETLDPDADDEFWDFSFHEMGIYDAASIIDHILEKTGNDKISYIGHFQGSTQFFVLASEKPEYNDKINIMMALAPAAYSQNITNPIIGLIKDLYVIVELVSDYFSITEVFEPSSIIISFLRLICSQQSEYQEVCPLVYFLFFGFDSVQYDRAILPTMLDVFPAGSSMKTVKHFLALVKSGYFRQFDYGILNNFEIYNQSAPPDYNINEITAPVALYYAKNDFLVSTVNVEQLADELPNVVETYLIEYDYFNHMDYIVATDVVSMLYYDLINKLNDVNGLDTFTTTSTTTVTTTTTPRPTSTSDLIDQESTTPGSAFSVNSFVHITCILMLSMMFII